VIVLITDSVRFPDIVDRVAAIARAVPPEAIAIQVREKQMDGAPLLALVRAVMAAAPGVAVWVNDRVDVALAARAFGVHLPERGMTVADARALAPALRIGVSRHAPMVVDADVVQLGPIFETPGKGPPLGTGVLGVRAQLPRTTRLVAVGGIDSIERAREAIAAGADDVAVIRAAWTWDLAQLTELVAAAAR
jgi:thiamine-phosphate pyrophosphorylase